MTSENDLRSSPTPNDVIHSASPTPASPAPAQSPDSSPSAKTRKFSVFSPRGPDNNNAMSLRRLFSPSNRRRSAMPEAFSPHVAVPQSPRDSDESSCAVPLPDLPPTPSRRRRFHFPFPCPCFGHKRATDDSLQEFDFGAHLKNLEPTYEPEYPLLPSPEPHAEDRICLVLDLDETLVHSSFTPLAGADFEIPLEMQGETHTVYVKKRPGVDDFLAKVSQWYEIVVFTASLALYANPVMDLLDPQKLVQLRLYREHCVLIGGCYVKDIAKLGRDLKRTFIIDNSPLSYVLQPENAIPITAFFADDNDRELEKTLALLEKAKHVKDVRKAFS